ncbi:MAG: redox-sensing transcriptional repressor rex [candidate division Zixibacteria bacterium SM23_81]|nr:MAG: redox-sensing transcriptional repressor rex [candidate division Zixibacteria bacterium SM23_81]
MSRISDATITRLSQYYRSLASLEEGGQEMVSSMALARKHGVTPAQVRKDLSCFGQFGTRGLGYSVCQLKETIARILGLHRIWNVALVGAGSLGSALISYKEFKRQGFHIVAVFDNDLDKVGKKRRGLTILDIRRLPQMVKKLDINLAIIAVPKDAAQSVADLLIKAGLKMILNFAPISLKASPGITIRNVNMAIELEALSYRLVADKSFRPGNNPQLTPV